MDFQVVGVGRGQERVIVAQGTIDNGTTGRLQAFLSSNPDPSRHRPTILFASPGGTVLGAIALGKYLHGIGATSVVGVVRDLGGPDGPMIAPGVCAASCVYAFAGGARRILPSRSVLGVERMRFAGPGASDAATYGQVIASLRNYMRSMGVDSRFADYCEQLPDGELHTLTPSEVAQWRLAVPR